MKNKDTDIEKMELVIDIIHYAEKHNLNINNKEEVEQILKAIKSGESIEDIDELMELLENADIFIAMTSKKVSKKTHLPN